LFPKSGRVITRLNKFRLASLLVQHGVGCAIVVRVEAVAARVFQDYGLHRSFSSYWITAKILSAARRIALCGNASRRTWTRSRVTLITSPKRAPIAHKSR